MQYVTGRSQRTQRRKRFATAFGIGAGGGLAAGLTSFGLRRGLTHFRRIRAQGKIIKPPKIMTGTVRPKGLFGGRMGGRLFKAARYASNMARFFT